MNEVECLDCWYVWTEAEEGECCPNCGGDPADTIYIQFDEE